LTVFGASIIAPLRTGGHKEFYVLLVSEILDHDAQAANMMLNTILGVIKQHPLVDWTRIGTMWLVCDCGPHFRSYENAAHFLYTLVKTLKLQVHVLYLGEQHGKGACDRLFGWTNEWLTVYVQHSPVHGLPSLVDAYSRGAERMMREDPTGPKFLIKTFDPGEKRPSSRNTFQCPGFKITRTYSLSAKLSVYSSSGVSIRDNVFSDMSATEILSGWSIADFVTPLENEVWRRGYYDKPRAWESVGPQAGDVTELTRKFASQKKTQKQQHATAQTIA
jgi:hypothetical protein